jgi:nicotinate-nucleotide--dimethylbenzimidazole phosphoribosyltransferase
MVGNFLSGGAAINVFARQHQLELIVIDAGVNADLPKHPKLISAKISKGTHNFLKKPAMSLQACINTIKTGADLVLQQYQNGCNCIGFGEMGIGNTSSAALLMQSLTGIPLKQCVGRGTGINNAQFQNKFNVLQQVLNHHKNLSTPLDILATLGGYEIAMMVGAYLKAAENGILIIVDGFIASAALLVAYKLYPEVLDYCVFSHVSNEQGHQALLKYFNVNALLNLNLRLGEGSGIALAYPLLQSAVLFLTEMATFNEASIDNLDCLHS